jgi:hypothetical protein
MQLNSPARRRSPTSWSPDDERDDAWEQTVEEFSLASSDYDEDDEDDDWEDDDWEDDDWDDERRDDEGDEDEREDRYRR